jgi:hypothetical protein
MPERRSSRVERKDVFARIREHLLAPRCSCTHAQTEHEDGHGQCLGRYHVSSDEHVKCWCAQFDTGRR